MLRLFGSSNRDDDALEILADLHGNGDRNNELVRLEFEEIKQQVGLLMSSSRNYIH